MKSPDLAHVTALTFDCYGTLIDWETGAIEALRHLLARHGVVLSDDEIIRAFQDIEDELCEPYQPYKALLAGVVEGFGRRFGFPVGTAERVVGALPRHGRGAAHPRGPLQARGRLEHRRRPVRRNRPAPRRRFRPRRDRRAGPLLQAPCADLPRSHPPPLGCSARDRARRGGRLGDPDRAPARLRDGLGPPARTFREAAHRGPGPGGAGPTGLAGPDGCRRLKAEADGRGQRWMATERSNRTWAG